MSRLNKGDIVRCLDSRGYERELTVGKEYSVSGVGRVDPRLYSRRVTGSVREDVPGCSCTCCGHRKDN